MNSHPSTAPHAPLSVAAHKQGDDKMDDDEATLDQLAEQQDAADPVDRPQAFAYQQQFAAKDQDDDLQLKRIFALGFALNTTCRHTLVEYLNETQLVFPVANHVALVSLETHQFEFLHAAKTVKSIQCFHLSTHRDFLVVVEKHEAVVVNHLNTASLADSSMTSSMVNLMSPPTSPMATSNSLAPNPIAVAATATAAAAHIISTTPTGAKSKTAAYGFHHGNESLQVTIYKTSTKKCVQTIALPANTVIVSCCLSYDLKFLVTLEDAPSHNICYYKLSTCKLLASSKCPSRGVRICLHPLASNFMSVSGPTLLKFWYLGKTGEFKIGNFLPQGREQEHFVDHVWVQKEMVALTEQGILLVFRTTSIASQSAELPNVELIRTYSCHQPSFVRVECINSYAKGFVVAGSAGFFSIYEISEDVKDPFLFVRSVHVAELAIENVAVSPTCEFVVGVTKTKELFSFAMNSIDAVQDDHVVFREVFDKGFHVGSIVQLEICLQRPILVTCGYDRTIRIWNYRHEHYELVYSCSEEPSSIALHPSGFELIIACKERVRMCTLLQGSLRISEELFIKSCHAVKFSTGGHLFACACGITISTYKTLTCQPQFTFSGHIGAVHCLAWSSDDLFLYSCGNDGTMYRWDMAKGARSEEDNHHVIKQNQYLAMAVDANNPKLVVVSGTDGYLREIVAGDETKAYEIPNGMMITSMVLSQELKRLFAATSFGSVLIMYWPISHRILGEFFLHSESITQLRLTQEQDRLVSCSEDGSICIYRILRTSNLNTNAPINQDRLTSMESLSDNSRMIFSDMVLLGREELEEKDQLVLEMRQQHDQIKADVEFTLHRKENEWIDRLRLTKEESEHLMVQERLRYEELENRYQQTLRKHIDEIAQLEANHVKMAQELENQYEHRLTEEVHRYDALSEELESVRQRCGALIESQDQQNRRTLQSERKASHSRAKEQNDVIKRLHDDLKFNHVKFEEVLHQQESEYEQELRKLRMDYENQLEAERQNTAAKQGQLSAASTKLESLKKKMQELKASSHARDVLLSTEQAKAQQLEATLQNYELELETHKSTLADKDKEIATLKSANRILENFRFVLDHRVNSLETEKAPMQEHMMALETHINGMQDELVDEYRNKSVIAQDIENKDAKIKLLSHEVKMLRQNMLKKEYSMSEMTREFTRIAQMTNIKDMEAAVKDAYRVFVNGETLRKKPPRITTKSPLSPIDKSPKSPMELMLRSPKRGNSPTVRPRASTAQTASPVHSPSKQAAAQKGANAAKSPEKTQTPPQSKVVDDLGYNCKEAVNESAKQIEFMTKTIASLRGTLENTKSQAERVRRDAVLEGSFLIEECNRLRKQTKVQHMRIKELEHTIENMRVAMPTTASGYLPVPSSPLNPIRRTNNSDRGSQMASPKSYKSSSPSSQSSGMLQSASTPQLHPNANGRIGSPHVEISEQVTDLSSPCKLQPIKAGKRVASTFANMKQRIEPNRSEIAPETTANDTTSGGVVCRSGTLHGT